MMENIDQTLDCAIGLRVKTLRQTRGMTLHALASASGVSRAMISRIERAEASPTAALLARLCAALGLSLSDFFADDTSIASPVMRKADQPVWRDPATGYVRRSVSPPGHGFAVDLVEVEFPKGAWVTFPPLNAAPGMQQYVWLFEGVLEMTAGGAVYLLQPGDCLYMTLGDTHAFYNPGEAPARYAVVVDTGSRSFLSFRPWKQHDTHHPQS